MPIRLSITARALCCALGLIPAQGHAEAVTPPNYQEECAQRNEQGQCVGVTTYRYDDGARLVGTRGEVAGELQWVGAQTHYDLDSRWECSDSSSEGRCSGLTTVYAANGDKLVGTRVVVAGNGAWVGALTLYRRDGSRVQCAEATADGGCAIEPVIRGADDRVAAAQGLWFAPETPLEARRLIEEDLEHLASWKLQDQSGLLGRMVGVRNPSGAQVLAFITRKIRNVLWLVNPATNEAVFQRSFRGNFYQPPAFDHAVAIDLHADPEWRAENELASNVTLVFPTQARRLFLSSGRRFEFFFKRSEKEPAIPLKDAEVIAINARLLKFGAENGLLLDISSRAYRIAILLHEIRHAMLFNHNPNSADEGQPFFHVACPDVPQLSGYAGKESCDAYTDGPYGVSAAFYGALLAGERRNISRQSARRLAALRDEARNRFLFTSLAPYEKATDSVLLLPARMN